MKRAFLPIRQPQSVTSMIVGSGLLANAFASQADNVLADSCIYAAGVSNSACQDRREFERERERLLGAMRSTSPDSPFIYFGTCSIDDPEAQKSAYVQHKAAMESFVRERISYLIFRLPQLAGFTPNPHTLLNYLFSRIIRSERFQVWGRAHRNLIDVDDVVKIARDMVTVEKAVRATINIANTRSSSMFDIVRTMEEVLGRRAIFDTIDQGNSYNIDTQRIMPALQRCAISFSPCYLHDVVRKYYGHHV